MAASTVSVGKMPAQVLPLTEPGCNSNGSVGKKDHNEPLQLVESDLREVQHH